VVRKQLEHVIEEYLRQVWDKIDWLYEGKHGFRPGSSCKIQIITLCQDIPYSLDEVNGIDVIILDNFKAFNLVRQDRLLTKLAASGVDSRVVFWIRKFLLDGTHNVRVGRKLSKEVKVTSFVPQGSIFGPLLFLVYVNDIWRNIASSITLFADSCVLYREITNINDIENLQKFLNTLGEWVVEDVIKMNPGKSKVIRFTTAWFKNPLGYSLFDKIFPEANSYKYLGIIL
jgi:hypothetical protein